MCDDTPAVGAHTQTRTTVTLHHGSALLLRFTAASTTTVSRTRRALSRTRPDNQQPATEKSGLVPHAVLPLPGRRVVTWELQLGHWTWASGRIAQMVLRLT